jgi:hypothetical protein
VIRHRILAIVAVAFFSATIFPLPAQARSHYVASGHAVHGVERDHNGKIKRSQQAKAEFKKQQPCPATGRSSGACPGYVIDHVRPLKRGGKDRPENMQWQTKEEAKAKDRWE